MFQCADERNRPGSQRSFSARLVGGFLGLMVAMRLGACTAGALASMLGAYLVTGLPALTMKHVLTCCIAVAILIASSNLLNDVKDARVDALSGQRRPIPSGHVSRGLAAYLALTLGIIGVVIAWTTGVWPLLLAIAACLTGWMYSIRLKGTIL